MSEESKNTIRIQIGSGVILVSAGTVASLVQAVMDWLKTNGVPPLAGPLVLIGGLVLLFWTLGRRLLIRIDNIEAELRGAQLIRAAGAVTKYDNRGDWYRSIAAAIRNAPNNTVVRDTTCGPRRKGDQTPDEVNGRTAYLNAVTERPGLRYLELYSSNWQPEVVEVLGNTQVPRAVGNTRVIPCSSPQFLFTDFLVVGDNRVFLSGLEFPGGELDLEIEDHDMATFFGRYYDLLHDSACRVRLHDGGAILERPGVEPHPLTVQTGCAQLVKPS